MKMNNKGFTLIELLAVIAILGILVILAAPQFMDVTDEAEETASDADRRTLQGEVDRYNTKNNNPPIGGNIEDGIYEVDEDKVNIRHIDYDKFGIDTEEDNKVVFINGNGTDGEDNGEEPYLEVGIASGQGEVLDKEDIFEQSSISNEEDSFKSYFDKNYELSGEFEAVSDEDYEFSYWFDGESLIDNEVLDIDIELDEDKSYNAFFYHPVEEEDIEKDYLDGWGDTPDDYVKEYDLNETEHYIEIEFVDEVKEVRTNWLSYNENNNVYDTYGFTESKMVEDNTITIDFIDEVNHHLKEDLEITYVSDMDGIGISLETDDYGTRLFDYIID